jgi:hypothetical protein
LSSKANETLLTIALAGFGLYFAVLMARGLAGYLRFRRVWPTALLTWPVRRPANFGMLVGLGVLAAAVALLNGMMHRPLHHVASQAAISLYFLLMVPLSARIHLGLYRDGVWADDGFLPYARIGRMAFRETPEIVLILLPRGGASGSFRLPVPRDEYAAVRKVLEEKIRARVLNVESGLLGL